MNTSAPTPPETQAPRRRSRRARQLAKPGDSATLTGAQRLLLLDTWRRSGLPAGDFAPLVGISKHTLYAWKHEFETEGPAGLEEKPRGGPTWVARPEVLPKGVGASRDAATPFGSTSGRATKRLAEVTKRTILMLKQDNPDWGCERISSMLMRGPALPASPQAVARVLHDDAVFRANGRATIWKRRDSRQTSWPVLGGLTGCPPAQSWRIRKAIGRQERKTFASTVRACTQEPREKGANSRRESFIQREALVHALVRHELLGFTTTSVPKPYPPRRRKCRPP